MPNNWNHNPYAGGVSSVGGGNRSANNFANPRGGSGGYGGGGGFDINALINMPTNPGQPNNNPGAFFNAMANNNVGLANADALRHQADQQMNALIAQANAQRDAMMGTAGINSGVLNNQSIYQAGAALGQSRDDRLARERESLAQERIADIMRQMNMGVAGINTGSNERIAGGRNDLLKLLGGGLFDTLGNVFGGLGQNLGGSLAMAQGGMIPPSNVPSPSGFRDPYARMIDQLRGAA